MIDRPWPAMAAKNPVNQGDKPDVERVSCGADQRGNACAEKNIACAISGRLTMPLAVA
ncbi:hypothetical protein MM182_14210 [Aeromonas sp. MR19]|uniref:hypothetical protein n=1 Tax=Aeromonas sp. MR19 TaxID=2923421 RepID=UPI001F4BA39F|nr:hypothetical protein [Aeromonas sp. MR19]MCH7376518.1 hypothetical protein [Aeromonas sp. MR19]